MWNNKLVGDEEDGQNPKKSIGVLLDSFCLLFCLNVLGHQVSFKKWIRKKK